MIRATLTDRAEIEAFLTPLAEYAMFPLFNLATYGMGGGHPYAVSFWLIRTSGQISDVLCQTDYGMVMPVLPSQDYAAAAGALHGRAVAGIVGPKHWARGLQISAGLTDAPSSLDQDEPQFLLHMSDLEYPDGPGDIAPLSQAPEDIIKDWMLDYQLRTLNTPPAAAAQRVHDSYRRYCDAKSHVVLMQDGIPLAMTGFNAHLPDIVQVGGVYTPPALRGKGYARRAIALHLARAKEQGVTRATLFSANDSASTASRALGFQQIGLWTSLLLQEKRGGHG